MDERISKEKKMEDNVKRKKKLLVCTLSLKRKMGFQRNREKIEFKKEQ